MEDYDPMIEGEVYRIHHDTFLTEPSDDYHKISIVDEEIVCLDVVTRASQEGYELVYLNPTVTLTVLLNHNARLYRSLDRIHDMQASKGFILAYSMTSRTSFEEMEPVFQEIYQRKGQDSFPVVLIANKCDAESDREVTMDGKKRSAISESC